MHTLRWIAVAMAAALPPALMTTCVDVEQAITIYPDGSGRIVAKVRIKKDKPPEEGDVEEGIGRMIADKDLNGIDAWLIPTWVAAREGDHTFYTWTLTGYFRDINKLTFRSAPGSPADPPPFQLKRTKDKSTLTFHDTTIEGMLDRAKKPLDAGEKSDSDDIYSVTMTVPGAITESRGFHEVKDRTASFRIDEKALFNARKGDPAAKKLVEALAYPATVSWKDNAVPKAELDAFRKEFDKALSGWSDLKERATKIYEQREKERKAGTRD